jgi:hypothetical protein
MAFNPAPTSLWPSYSSDGTSLTISLAALPGLTSAEANATTGDWRNVLLAIVSSAYAHYAGLTDADVPQALKLDPPQMYPVTSGPLEGTFRTTYAMQFYCEYAVPNVAEEPA